VKKLMCGAERAGQCWGDCEEGWKVDEQRCARIEVNLQQRH
jgi:hypothetical protein